MSEKSVLQEIGINFFSKFGEFSVAMRAHSRNFYKFLLAKTLVGAQVNYIIYASVNISTKGIEVFIEKEMFVSEKLDNCDRGFGH